MWQQDQPDLQEGQPAQAETTVVVERMDHGPVLVIEQAEQLAYDFFTEDESSLGDKAYDQQVGKGDPNRIAVEDIVAINTTMRARSPHLAWEVLTAGSEPLPWLAAIPTDLRLFGMLDQHWVHQFSVLEAALEQAVAPHRNLSVATKVLHLKRPHLFPVLDSLVVQQIGGVGRPAMELLAHIREVGLSNRDALSVVGAHLEKHDIVRTPVRILDALLWASHPAAGIAPRLRRWRHIVTPREA